MSLLRENQMVYKLGKYKPSDKMSDLVCENYSTLLVMSRFGIALGFGERSIAEVCRDAEVDTATFLAVVNMMLYKGPLSDEECDNISVDAFMDYLHNSHTYYLKYRLPSIRAKLLAALGDGDIAVVIARFFDEYETEVRKHMSYEERTLLPYVRALLEGVKPADYDIDTFERQHDDVEEKMSDLKNILIKYYPAVDHNELNVVLFDIFAIEEDLAAHNFVENNLLIPIVKRLEHKIDVAR